MEGIGDDCQRVGVLLGVDVLPLAGDVVDALVHRVPQAGVQAETDTVESSSLTPFFKLDFFTGVNSGLTPPTKLLLLHTF